MCALDSCGITEVQQGELDSDVVRSFYVHYHAILRGSQEFVASSFFFFLTTLYTHTIKYSGQTTYKIVVFPFSKTVMLESGTQHPSRSLPNTETTCFERKPFLFVTQPRGAALLGKKRLCLFLGFAGYRDLQGLVTLATYVCHLCIAHRGLTYFWIVRMRLMRRRAIPK